MTADALRRMAWSASQEQQGRIKKETREREAIAAFQWLEQQGVTYIEFANGGALDVGNLHGDLRYAVWLAKQGETHA